MLDLMTYIEKGDDLLLHLYSGRGVRGVYVDHDDFAIILVNHDGSEQFRRIVPHEEIEFPTIVKKIKKIEAFRKQAKKVEDDNKESDGD